MKELRLRAQGLHWREVDDEIIALEGESSTYLAANPTGAMLWQSLAEGTTRESLVSQLVDAFGLDRDSAAADVDNFLSELAARGLLED